MAINISKVFAEYLKGSILDLVDCFFLIVYLGGEVGRKRTKRDQKEVERICALSIKIYHVERFCGGSKFVWVVLI